MQKNRTDVNISNVNQYQTLQGNSCGSISNRLADSCLNVYLTLEDHLEMCAANKRFAPLWTSWKTEKSEYVQKLKAVDKTFTTYSSHDAEHSEMIIRRVEALLGVERIRLLSPTDTWLLLQCAYTHDLGMCVTDREKEELLRRAQENPDEARKIFRDVEYKNYVETLTKTEKTHKTNIHNGTRISAYFWQKRMEENDVDLTEYLQDVFGSDFSKALYYFNLTVTNYFRQKHAERSYEQIRAEAVEKTYGNQFPLSLRYIVADIDRCHGLGWDSVMNLEYEQNGFDNDFIHPRFIAALLRLGDLLDLDSNRFNPFVYGNVQTKPLSSQSHRIKHLSVTNFLVNPKEIRITSKFDTTQVKKILLKDNIDAKPDLLRTDLGNEEDVYQIITSSIKAAGHWLQMIRADSQEFALSWNDIAPPDFPGSIATLTQSSIFWDGRLIHESDLDLSYEISSSRASEIIEGSGLYKSSLAFLRELIQNAVDATKIQLYFEICEDHVTAKDEMLQSYQAFIEKTAQLREEHKIEIRFKILYSKENLSPQSLIIEVEDRGTGITEDRLSKMKNIGNIIDVNLKNAIKQMPEWMKPTGDFGIGMQSVFSYTDRFRVITRPRKLENGKFVERRITFNSTRLGGDIVSRDTVIHDVNAVIKRKENVFGKSDLSLTHGGTQIRVELDLKKQRTINRLLAEKNEIQTPLLINFQDKLQKIIREFAEETLVGEIIPIEFQFVGFQEGNSDEPKTTAHTFVLNSPVQFRLPFDDDREKMDTAIEIIDYPKYKPFNKCSESEKSIFYCCDETKGKQQNCVTIHFRRSKEKSGQTQLFFRGIAFEADHNDEDYLQLSKMIQVPFFNCCINILCRQAGDIIEINRDRVVREKYLEICQLIQECLHSFYKDLFLRMSQSQKFLEVLETIINTNNEIWSFLYALFLLYEEKYSFSSEQITGLKKLFSEKTRGNLDGALLDIDGKKVIYNAYPISSLMGSNNEIIYTDSSELNSVQLLDGQLGKKLGKNYVYMVQNWFSEIFMLYYKSLYVFQPESWTGGGQLLKVYRLTCDEDSFPEIDDNSYQRIVDDILAFCLQQIEDGQITKQYHPCFPATKEFKAISVSKAPIGISKHEKDRFNKWIISPLPMRLITRESISEADLQTFEGSSEYMSIINQLIQEKQNDKEDSDEKELKEQYRRFLAFIGLSIT